MAALEQRKRKMTAKDAARLLGRSERSVRDLVAQPRAEWLAEQAQRRLAILETYEASEETTWEDVGRRFGIDRMTAYQLGSRARREREAAEREKIEPPLPLAELGATSWT